MTFIALVPSIYYNVKQYGALGDGSTDDTTAIAAAMSAASGSGGIVFFPPGIYVSGNQTLLAKVSLRGAGITATTLRLKAGANTDLLSAQTSSINLSATLNSGTAGTLLTFAIEDMTLDGNKANQTSGTSYPLRFYGYNFILRDLEVLNGYTGGALIDWNGGSSLTSPSDNMESYIDTCKFHDNNGIGLQLSGPHDSRLHNVISFSNGSHNFHFAPNSAGALCTNCHGYLNPNTTGVCCYLVESACQFVNCVAEGSFHCDLAILAANVSWIGGNIFGTSSDWASEVGIQLGQNAGNTPFPGQILQSAGVTTAAAATGCRIDTFIIETHGGAINAINEGSNVIIANVYLTAGTALVGNTINKATDAFILNVQGLTTDNTLGKSGGMNVATNGSSYAFTVTDLTNGGVFGVDNYGNINMSGAVNTAGGFLFTASTTPAALATNGTINTQGLANSTVGPTADVTGIILQSGYPGELCLVQNVSNYTITFATSATSHVANGTLCKIPANTACYFFYDNTNSLWSSCGLQPLPTQSATATAIATNGTITTTDIDEARVSPTGAVTGVILQAGIFAGQEVWVVNEAVAANTVTMAASGTSHVADGVSSVIPGLRGTKFKWNSSTSLWYRG